MEFHQFPESTFGVLDRLLTRFGTQKGPNIVHKTALWPPGALLGRPRPLPRTPREHPGVPPAPPDPQKSSPREPLRLIKLVS